MRGSRRREYEADCGRQSSIAEDVRLRRVAVNGSNALLVQPAGGFDVQFNDRWDDALLPQQSADCLSYRSIANHHGSRTGHCSDFIFEERLREVIMRRISPTCIRLRSSTGVTRYSSALIVIDAMAAAISES